MRPTLVHLSTPVDLTGSRRLEFAGIRNFESLPIVCNYIPINKYLHTLFRYLYGVRVPCIARTQSTVWIPNTNMRDIYVYYNIYIKDICVCFSTPVPPWIAVYGVVVVVVVVAVTVGANRPF